MPEPMRPEGEDDRGIECRRHPQLVINEQVELRAVIDRWNVGARRAISLADWDTLTNWELECVLELHNADARERDREVERLKRGNQESSGSG